MEGKESSKSLYSEHAWQIGETTEGADWMSRVNKEDEKTQESQASGSGYIGLGDDSVHLGFNPE